MNPAPPYDPYDPYDIACYVDGHLDLAYNAVMHRRDLTLPLETMRKQEGRSREEALVTLLELQQAGVGVVFGTLFALPATVRGRSGSSRSSLATGTPAQAGYHTPAEAKRMAVAQLEAYLRLEESGWLRLLRTGRDLQAHLTAFAGGDKRLGMVLLMEGADPVLDASDLAWWVGQGVRMVGLSWQQTRYAGGTHAPGPLTPAGRELVVAMREQGVVLDVSHLAEESFWQALELSPAAVIASHSNARALTPTDRHLSDAMIAAIAARDGVVGLVLGNPFVKAGVTRDTPKHQVTLQDVRAQAEHIARLVGWQRVAVGSDFDGGFGLQETPLEITRGADFARLGEVVPKEARASFLGGAWLRLLHRVLPG